MPFEIDQATCPSKGSLRSPADRDRARGPLASLIEELWDGSRFTARRLDGDAWVPVPCDSLIPCIPIFLGMRLPAAIRQALVADAARFLTPTDWRPTIPTVRPTPPMGIGVDLCGH